MSVGDVHRGAAELVPHRHDLARVPGQQRVGVAAEGDLRLIADGALDLDHRGERRGHGPQRFGVGQLADRGPHPVPGPLAGVEPGADPV